MTSETRADSTPARSSAALMAVLPSSWAGKLAKAPLKAPTGVRTALTITTSSFMVNSFRDRGYGAVAGRLTARSISLCHKDATGPRQGANWRKPAGHRWYASRIRPGLHRRHAALLAPNRLTKR